jgi:hypothetical protein
MSEAQHFPSFALNFEEHPHQFRIIGEYSIYYLYRLWRMFLQVERFWQLGGFKREVRYGLKTGGTLHGVFCITKVF